MDDLVSQYVSHHIEKEFEESSPTKSKENTADSSSDSNTSSSDSDTSSSSSSSGSSTCTNGSSVSSNCTSSSRIHDNFHDNINDNVYDNAHDNAHDNIYNDEHTENYQNLSEDGRLGDSPDDLVACEGDQVDDVQQVTVAHDASAAKADFSGQRFSLIAELVPTFSHLRVLEIRNCGLDTCPTFLPSTVEKLDLSHNQIHTIENLRHLKQLVVLSLTHNLITRIEVQANPLESACMWNW